METNEKNNQDHDAHVHAVSQWIQLHLPQLTHYNVPKHLHEEVYQCVTTQDAQYALESLVTLEDTPTPDAPHQQLQSALISGRQRLRHIVRAKRALQKDELVRRVGHIWEFTSVVDAQAQLQESDELRSQMVQLVKEVLVTNGSNGGDGSNTKIVGDEVFPSTPPPEEASNLEEASKQVEFVIRHLHFLAFSIRFGQKSTDMSYYVLNSTGSSLHEAKTFNFHVVPIFCLKQQKLFSIAWPAEEIAEGDELTRPHATKISMMALCKKSYWETRYEGEEEYDWYCEYVHIRDVLASYIDKQQRVLVAGSGTSRLPIDMYLDNYSDVHAMDFAANVVKKMQQRCTENAWNIKYVEADMTSMVDWATYSVDCIIDKGCLDTMLLKPETEAIENNWKIVVPDSEDDLDDAKRAMQEAARILKPDGYFILITFGNPTNRIGLFDWVDTQQTMQWDVLQCLEMSPDSGLRGFSARFYLFVAQKKLI